MSSADGCWSSAIQPTTRAVTGNSASSTEKRRTGIRRRTLVDAVADRVREHAGQAAQDSSVADDHTGPLVGAPTGVIAIVPIAKPTPSPATPGRTCATREPTTMYSAHIGTESRMKNTPSVVGELDLRRA